SAGHNIEEAFRRIIAARADVPGVCMSDRDTVVPERHFTVRARDVQMVVRGHPMHRCEVEVASLTNMDAASLSERRTTLGLIQSAMASDSYEEFPELGLIMQGVSLLDYRDASEGQQAVDLLVFTAGILSTEPV
ncbi:MAG: hypothetical protein ACPG77_20775, partial [Nannocystaceae bacterium]